MCLSEKSYDITGNDAFLSLNPNALSNTANVANAQHEFVCIWSLITRFSGITFLKSYCDGIDALNKLPALNTFVMFFRYVVLSVFGTISYFLGSTVFFLSSSLKLSHFLYASEYSASFTCISILSVAYTIPIENMAIIISIILNNFTKLFFISFVSSYFLSLLLA